MTVILLNTKINIKSNLSYSTNYIVMGYFIHLYILSLFTYLLAHNSQPHT